MSNRKELKIGTKCGHIVKQVRLELNCTQAEFGKKIGVSPYTITCIERREKLPSESILEKIARLTGVSTYQLTGQESICYAAIY